MGVAVRSWFLGTKILLADDHRLLRDGLRDLLEKEGLEIVGEASSGSETVALFASTRPDVLVMDVCMPELDGVETTRQVLAMSPAAKVIGLSMKSDRQNVIAMFAAGSSAYLVKTAPVQELVLAIQEVMAGKKYVSPSIAHILVDAPGAGSAAPGPTGIAASPGAAGSKALSAREEQVLQLLSEGFTSKVIAEKLFIGLATIETHRRHIMDKLNLRSVAELTKYAIRKGLTSPE